MWCTQFIIHTILVAAGLWHHGSLFYHDTQYSQLGWFINLLWCDIPLNKAPCTGHHITSGAFIHCALSLASRTTQMTGQLGGRFCWVVFVIVTLESENIFLFWVWCQQSEFHWWLPPCVWFFPGHCNRHLQRSALFTLFCMTWHRCNSPKLLRYECLLQWQQNRSKATMYQCNSFSYSRVPKTFLVDWQLFVTCYYPTTPTDYPSTTRGTSMGTSVAESTNFCGYL
jgi:hypothetical protein